MSIFLEIQEIDYILRLWKKNPNLRKKDYERISWWKNNSPENNLPPTIDEIHKYLNRLKELNPTNTFIKEQEIFNNHRIKKK